MNLKKIILIVFASIFIYLIISKKEELIENPQMNNSDKITNLLFNLNTSKITSLGYKNIDELYLLGNNKPTDIDKIIKNVNGDFYTFEYDNIFIIQTKQNANITTLNAHPNQNAELYYTIRALEIFKEKYSFLYQKLVESTLNLPFKKEDISNYTNWLNTYPKIIISFNTVNNDIAISGTYLDNAPLSVLINNQKFSHYKNLPIISINSEVIKGINKYKGSYPIYKFNTANDNYEKYLKEGLLHSICHELLHRYIDIKNNKKGTIFNYIAFGNGRLNKESANFDRNIYNLEEVMVNQTLHNYFVKHGGLSDVLLEYYKNVQNNNYNAIQNKQEYKNMMMKHTDINYDFSLNL